MNNKTRGDSKRFNLHGYYGSEKQRNAGKKGFINGAKTRKDKSSKLRGDYEDNPKHCPQCQSKIPFEKRFNVYCSHKCAGANSSPKGRTIPNFVYSDAQRARFEAIQLEKKRVYFELKSSYELNPRTCCKCGEKLPFQKRTRKTCGSQICIRICLSETYEKRRKVGRTSIASWYDSPTAGRVYLESTWELAVAIDLDKNQIEWIRPKHIKWQDEKGFWHRYNPDFYLTKLDVYLDPKNHLVRAHPRTKEKLLAIKNQCNVTLILLDGNQLTWSSIQDLIKVHSVGFAPTMEELASSD